MDLFWSASTTMRNPERTLYFLKTASEIEGEVWDDDTQCKFQTLLIKNRYYTPTAKNLPDELFSLITDYTHEMTYEEADKIFKLKKYVDAPMRGRTSFDPLEKLGLVSIDRDEQDVKRVRITDFGKMFLENKIDLGEVVFTSLLKYQFPNPLEDARLDYCVKPFIGTLRLIKKVNEICKKEGINIVGISREEFGIFVLSLKSYLDIDTVARKIIDFRENKRKLKTDDEKTNFVNNYISEYLSNYQNPHVNIKEYTDNIIRYLRLTKYIYIRGGGYYIDLEPRRMIEIDAILSQDNGQAIKFTQDEYKKYISDYYAYTLPFETVETLTKIANRIIDENIALAKKLNVTITTIDIPLTKEELKKAILKLRNQRNELLNIQLKYEFQDVERIDNAITALSNILKHNTQGKPSIELEKWVNIALNILNDAKLIKPNAPLGDDNEPTFTAPANVPDIECYYDNFGAICEVTMLTGRDQWYNEGQPVMRHLRTFEETNNDHENYCLFIAPKLHRDTINTFLMAVKYGYEGKAQKIVPITITDLISILGIVRNIKAAQKPFQKENIRRLYDSCVNIPDVSDPKKWADHIYCTISAWAEGLT